MRTTQRLRHSMLGLLLVTTGAIAAPANDSGQAANPSSASTPPPTPIVLPANNSIPEIKPYGASTAPITPIVLPADYSVQDVKSSSEFTLPLPNVAAPANDSSRAEKPSSEFILPPPVTTPTSDVDPYSERDPDGVPLTILIHHDKPTQAEIDEFHRQLDIVAQNKNWLLRGYEQQQQLHNSANGVNGQSTNLYLQISTNKALAKLAGLSDADADIMGLKTGTDIGANGAALRKDPTAQVSTAMPSISNLSKPLISPLGSPTDISTFNAPLPLTMTPAYSGILPQSPSTTTADVIKAQETADLDIPGMTAEKKDPTADTSNTDLNLDILPGESIGEAKMHQDNFKTELALPMDADLLHKQQTVEITVPSVTKITPENTTQATLPTKPGPPVDPSAPTPVSQMPVINPVRPPIPGPYDILNR